MQQPILKNLIVLAGCLLIAASAAAQRYVSGKVLDADNGPLAGATVFVKENRAIGMTTDAEGNYRLRLPDGKAYTLQASFIGYVTQSHALQPGQDRLDFALEEDAIGMETVVVTGTRTPKLLKDVPIVTRVITADDIRKVDATHIGDLGRAAGHRVLLLHGPADLAQHAGFRRKRRPLPCRRRKAGGRNAGQHRLQPPEPGQRGTHRNRERGGIVALWLECRGRSGQPHH